MELHGAPWNPRFSGHYLYCIESPDDLVSDRGGGRLAAQRAATGFLEGRYIGGNYLDLSSDFIDFSEILVKFYEQKVLKYDELFREWLKS